MNREFSPWEAQGRYEEFFKLFNQGQFFEAHEVLEPLWLVSRTASEAHFYKGLIQMAGAFVHVRKGRKSPALALLNLAMNNLRQYPAQYKGLDLKRVLSLADDWARAVEQNQFDGLAPAICLRR